MAKKTITPKTLTKSKLLAELDEKIQSLNLLKGALQADPSRKQEDLENYHKQFQLVILGSKK